MHIPRISKRRTIFLLTGLVAISVLLQASCCRSLADGAFYQPTTQIYDRLERRGQRYEDVSFPSTDGVTLHGRFYSAAGVTETKGTVVHCHGNAGNVSGHASFVDWLPAYGWNVLCFDYRGYGKSTGKVTRRGTIDDATAALRYALGRDDVDPDTLCVIGQSLGGAVAITALGESDIKVAGLCVDGAFSSYQTEARFVAGRSWILWAVSPVVSRLLVTDDLSPLDYVGRLPAYPKLFICGTADTIVDYRQTAALHEAATPPSELWIIENAGHTAAMTGEIEGGRQRVLDFLNSCVKGDGMPPDASRTNAGD